MDSLHTKISLHCRQEWRGLEMSLLHSSSHISSVKTKIQAQYLIDSEIYTLLPGAQSETAAEGPIAKSARKY